MLYNAYRETYACSDFYLNIFRCSLPLFYSYIQLVHYLVSGNLILYGGVSSMSVKFFTDTVLQLPAPVLKMNVILSILAQKFA